LIYNSGFTTSSSSSNSNYKHVFILNNDVKQI
jgi:hypothetical protein